MVGWVESASAEAALADGLRIQLSAEGALLNRRTRPIRCGLSTTPVRPRPAAGWRPLSPALRSPGRLDGLRRTVTVEALRATSTSPATGHCRSAPRVGLIDRPIDRRGPKVG